MHQGLDSLNQDLREALKSTLHVDPPGQKPNTINPDLVK